MDTLNTTVKTQVNNDELGTTVQNTIRGTDNNGNYIFEPYSPKAPVTAIEGYRVAKVMYKTNSKTGNIAGENSCLIVPHVTEDMIVDNVDRLIKHFVGMLEAEQDKIIKGLHLEAVSFVEPDKINVDAIIAALEAVAVSGRINKEMIEVWFSEEIEETLLELVAAKKGTTIDNEGVRLLGKNYKNSFSKMASNTTQYQPEQARILRDCLDKCCSDEGNSITIKLKAKLDKMINPVDVMMLDAL